MRRTPRDRTDPSWPWLLTYTGVVTVVLSVAALGIAALVIMLEVAGRATVAEQPKLQIDAIKYGLGLFAAAGAAAALLLGVRRQQHLERAQAHTELDAAERRVTDLYTKAVEQLGSADAAVRLGGLYALERVAQGNPAQRQTVVNVLCAYLRMPFVPPPFGRPPDPAPSPVGELPLSTRRPEVAGARDPHQELQVRLTAQRILTDHLTPGRNESFWSDVDLDLTGARLVDWSLARCRAGQVTFRWAEFTGDTSFSGAVCTGGAQFGGAVFEGEADFGGAVFLRGAEFGGATFTGDAGFSDSCFGEPSAASPAAIGPLARGDARFARATFDGRAAFDGMIVRGEANFGHAVFGGFAVFGNATFSGDAWFGEATFTGSATFGATTFAGDTEFGEATFSDVARFSDAVFTGDARFGEAAFAREAVFDRVTFTGGAWFDTGSFAGDARFDRARFQGDIAFSQVPGNATVHLGAAEITDRPDRLDAWPPGWSLLPSQSGMRSRLVQRPI